MSFLDPQNAALATAYLVDKVVGIYRDSYAPGVGTSVLGGYLYQKAIPHPFGRPVFAELSWSKDGSSYFDGGSNVSAATSGAIAYSDSSNIYITTLENTGTIYYKLVCSWIDDYDTTEPSITPVLNTASGLYFDSRKNYPKIDRHGVTTISGTGTKAITHGLGYAPGFKGYFESISGQVWPLIAGGTSDVWLYDFVNQMECYALIGTTDVTLNFTGPASSRRVWYRTYLA